VTPTPATATATATVCASTTAGFAHCDAHVRTYQGTATPHATVTRGGGFISADLRSAYKLTTDSTSSVAIVDAYANPNAASDLAAYRAGSGLPALTAGQLTQYSQTGGAITTVPSDVGWGQEEMLDLEMVSAVCPSCKIVYVGATSNSFVNLAAAVDQASTKGVKAISNSYGGGEYSAESTDQSHYNHPGIAVTVSSGDSGYGVEFPAASQYVTAVGGTHLVKDTSTRGWTETVWSGAGSGCSAYIPKPSWQHDTGCVRRTVADVSAVADPATGVAVYDSFGSSGGANWYVFGGTSVAAPIVGTVYALSGNTAGVPAQLAWTTPGGAVRCRVRQQRLVRQLLPVHRQGRLRRPDR